MEQALRPCHFAGGRGAPEATASRQIQRTRTGARRCSAAGWPTRSTRLPNEVASASAAQAADRACTTVLPSVPARPWPRRVGAKSRDNLAAPLATAFPPLSLARFAKTRGRGGRREQRGEGCRNRPPRRLCSRVPRPAIAVSVWRMPAAPVSRRRERVGVGEAGVPSRDHAGEDAGAEIPRQRTRMRSPAASPDVAAHGPTARLPGRRPTRHRHRWADARSRRSAGAATDPACAPSVPARPWPRPTSHRASRNPAAALAPAGRRTPMVAQQRTVGFRQTVVDFLRYRSACAGACHGFSPRAQS